MRILIVGAGLAGLTLAALLKQRGVEPEIIDRAPSFEHAGYMLSLYPLGNRVLHGLGLYDKFLDVSQPMNEYRVCNGHGELVHAYAIGEMMSRFGHIGLLSRGDLLAILRSGAPDLPLRMNTSIEALDQGRHHVAVRLSDGSEETYDLVVGADGIRSQVRDLLFGEVKPYETGWGCWIWWANDLPVPHNVATEYWGAGRLLGVYPTGERVGLMAGGPTRDLDKARVSSGAEVRAAFTAMKGAPAGLIQTIPDDLSQAYYWKLDDVRCPQWVSGRVALVGDSACGFLPTSGVGASMAMESASVLADELSRTDAHFIPRALELYERRRTTRARAVQDDSRKMARTMFVESTPLAWGRDQLMKFYSLESLVKNIIKSLSAPI